MRVRQLAKVVLVNFAVAASLVALLLTGVEAYQQVSRLFEPEGDPGRAATPNYEDAPWAEQHYKEMAELRLVYFSYVEWRRDLFSGETINIIGPFHERRTVVPETASGGAVFFFGGSTIWGNGARDQDTIPSFYANLTGRPARNFGEQAYTAHQGLEMLLWLLQKGERPDAVVFYDGVNDVTQKCRSALTDFSSAQEARMRAMLDRRESLIGALLVPIRVRLAAWWSDRRPEDERFDCDSDPAKARAVADALLRDWRVARMVAEAEGIKFFAFLQPVAYFSQTPLDHRADLNNEDLEKRKQFEIVYPMLRERLAEAAAVDLTAVLDAPEYIYVDFCHISPNGNARVAAALAASVETRLSQR